MSDVCNRDCFRCPYPDCIVDGMTDDEKRESRRIDQVLIAPADREASHKADTKFDAKEASRKRRNARKMYRYYNEGLRESMQQWAEEHREQIAATKRAWYEANKARILAQQKAYRAANAEKVRARKRAYEKRKREERKANEALAVSKQS